MKFVNGRCVATGFSSVKGHGIEVRFKNELKEKMSIYEGVYVQSTAMWNEHPSYVQKGGENGIWFNKLRNVWTIGKRRDPKGKRFDKGIRKKTLETKRDNTFETVEDVNNVWHFKKGKKAAWKTVPSEDIIIRQCNE